ncbi:LOW QUALITY PROTEIN: uncharacterized protein At4g14450, chloroplastic [Morus notabilis]|uniref:LOW QUALITY PROTEIN: uncharacterized protein At4g14450, chloroplastic n=1 Tax=Morus notabilis TaxID=981085 RepID=UPI000CED4837|nr:LOW QUALITY PROTEIN: uncharacterized protein At4g14450, chloroplastic [Morus notabilis]
MADVSRPISVAGARRQPSRLQRRAPASLQISPVSDWNVAIPLLSPLASPSSPPPPPNSKPLDRTADNKSRDADSDKPPVVVFKKWQAHPAAPFSYEPPKIVRPFVPA